MKLYYKVVWGFKEARFDRLEDAKVWFDEKMADGRAPVLSKVEEVETILEDQENTVEAAVILMFIWAVLPGVVGLGYTGYLIFKNRKSLWTQ